MNKFIKKTIVFFILLLALLFVKKNITPFYIGDTIFSAKYADFLKRNEQFNSVVFGSSRLYRQVNSLYLDSLLAEYNISTYNFSNGGTYNPESYFLYDNFINSIDSGKIKLAFVELQQLHPYSEENCKTTKASYWNTIRYLFYSFGYINNSEYDAKKNHELYKCYLKSYFFGLFDFSFLKNVIKTNSIKEIGKNGFYPLEKEMNENGINNRFKKRWDEFHADTTSLKDRIESVKISEKSNNSKGLNKYHLKYLNSLIANSNQKGIHLFFILPPRLKANQYDELIPISNSLPPENTIKLYSFFKFRELYMAEYSFDIGHLNSKGADSFTEYLANGVREKKHECTTLCISKGR